MFYKPRFLFPKNTIQPLSHTTMQHEYKLSPFFDKTHVWKLTDRQTGGLTEKLNLRSFDDDWRYLLHSDCEHQRDNQHYTQDYSPRTNLAVSALYIALQPQLYTQLFQHYTQDYRPRTIPSCFSTIYLGLLLQDYTQLFQRFLHT